MPNIDVFDKSSGTAERPFADWLDGRLGWWEVYTGIKHNLVDRDATLGVVLDMTKAYELLIFCVVAMREDIRIDYLDEPKLFKVGLPESNFRMTMSSRLERVYKRQEVLASLGY